MEKFIAQAIDCLKRQDDPDIEFILINDGSTDSTLYIMESLCADDDRFRIFSMPNKGYGYTCNFGIHQSLGEFIAIYEPDDFITSDFYSNLRCAAEMFSQADVIRYNGIYCNKNGNLKRLYCWKKQFTEKIIDKYTLKRFWRSHPSIFNGIYRKSFILQKSIYFCETPEASFQDAMFMVSLFYANPSLYIIDDIKYIYTIHTMQSINFINDKIDFIIKSWDIELDWISKNGFKDYNFFLYKVFIQMNNVIKKVSPENKEKILQKFKTLRNNYSIDSSIPTIMEKIKYTLLFK